MTFLLHIDDFRPDNIAVHKNQFLRGGLEGQSTFICVADAAKAKISTHSVPERAVAAPYANKIDFHGVRNSLT
jgi:hypothetical protein